jgi:hypothetical protein
MAYYSLLMIAIQMEMGDMQSLSFLSWGFSLTKKGRSWEREREFCPLFVSLSMSRLGVPTTTALFEMIAVRNLEY